MRELNIVIPVKDPHASKERLAPLLSPEERVELAGRLFDQVLALFKGLSAAYHILVVTDSDQVAERARAFSVSVLQEEAAEGETAAVERATAWSCINGFTSQLVVPADMACVDPAELAALLQRPRPSPSLFLCPATGDDGTNAILSTPPDVVPFRFGVRSFPEYRRRAAEKDVPCEVVRLNSFRLDLDTPEDLRAFMLNHCDHPLRKLLASWRIEDRLR